MAASATTGTYTPGDTGALLVNEAWQNTFEDAVYEAAKLYPLAVERARLYNKLHIRKLSAFTASSLASTYPASPGTITGFAYQANTETEVTISPSASLVALSVAHSQLKQMDISPMASWKQSTEDAMAQSIDLAWATNASLLTTTRGAGSGEDFSKALLASAIAALRASAKSEWDYPNGKPAYLGVHTSQVDDLLTIPEFMNANFRGDAANPNVKGLNLQAYGLTMVVSGNVYVDGSNVAWNPLFLPRAIGISFNQKTEVMEQVFQLEHRIIAYANYGTGVVRDEFAVAIKTNSA